MGVTDRPSLVFSRIQNPVMQTLVRYVKMQMMLAKKAEEGFSYHIATIALKTAGEDADEFDPGIIRTKLKAFSQAVREGDLRAILDIEQIIGLVLGIRCLYLAQMLKDEDVTVAREIVRAVETRAWLRSFDLASYVAFCFSDIKSLRDEVDLDAAWLNSQLPELLEKHQYSSYFSALFGVSFAPQHMTSSMPADEARLRAMLESEELGAKDLARLAISLWNLRNAVNVQLVADVLNKLEVTLSAEFVGKVTADLQMGIREAIALAASDIPASYANETLRRVNRELSRIIEIREGGIVFLSEPQAFDMPSMDVEQHSLALIAVSVSQRKHLYVLDEENFQNARQGSLQLKSGHRAISMRFAGAVKFVSTILAFMAGMMLPMLITGSSPQDILNAIRLTVQAGQLTWATISKLPLSISSIILGLYLALSYFRVMDYAFEHGSISLKALLQVLPIVSWIYKWFKGYKVEDDK